MNTGCDMCDEVRRKIREEYEKWFGKKKDEKPDDRSGTAA